MIPITKVHEDEPVGTAFLADPKQGSPVREDFTGLAMRLQLAPAWAAVMPCELSDNICLVQRQSREGYQVEAGPASGDAADPGRHPQQGTAHPTACSSARSEG